MKENIVIENYNCFKNFKLNGIKRVNLITGRNNVGKTTLLEAIQYQEIYPYYSNTPSEYIRDYENCGITPIVCSLCNCKDGYLFIDEIERGVHHSIIEDIFKIIFDVSETWNTTVFITTHSKEIIEGCARVLKDKDYTNMSLIELYKDKNKIKCMQYDCKRFIDKVEQGHELRG